MAQVARGFLEKVEASGVGRQSKQRHAELVAACRTRDAFAMLNMISTGELDGSWAPNAPDPEDDTLTKRQWQLSLQAWRAAVKSFVQ